MSHQRQPRMQLFTRTCARAGSTVTTRKEVPGPARTLSARVVAVVNANADSGNSTDAAMTTGRMNAPGMGILATNVQFFGSTGISLRRILPPPCTLPWTVVFPAPVTRFSQAVRAWPAG